MFNKKALKRNMILAVTLSLASVFSLTGCQKSPKSSIVVNKDLDKLIEQAGDTSKKGLILNKEYDTWKTTIEDENLRVKVNVDAKVDIPKTDKISVFRVAQQKISQELLDAVRKELIGDVKLYDGAALKKRTKADIEGEISMLRTEMEMFEKGDARYQECQAEIDILENEYNLAPSDISFTGYESDGKLQSVSDKYHTNQSDALYKWVHDLAPNGDVYYGISDGSDGNYSMLYALNSENYSNFISFRKGNHGYEHLGIDGFFTVDAMEENNSEYKSTGETANLTLENAVGIADEFLEKVGINDGKTEFRYNNGELTKENIPLERPVDSEYTLTRDYYVLTYTRYLDGAFITAGGNDKFDAEENDGSYKKMSWPTERIEFRINDSGIVGFDYKAPICITETVVDSSSMKSFEDICETFQKMSVVTNASDFSEVQMDINRITLGYALISEPDSFDTGLLVPVWDFIGTKHILVFEEKGEGAEEDKPCLTINAIDGSVVNRELGY